MKEFIEIKGARENNLKNIDIKIPEAEDKKEIEEHPKIYDSLNDIKRDINIFQENYIPDTSEYEIVFRRDECLIKSRKKLFNFNLALKHFRTLLENNSEENYYYAVIKIKKPL